jgi:cytochrome c biogenesis protein
MTPLLQRLASLRLTLAGFGLLAAGTLAPLEDPRWSLWAVLLPLAGLGVNLAAAIVLRPALRRGGLGVFHLALLAFLLLAGWGRLTHFDARVEVPEEGLYDPGELVVTGQGPWHGEDWKRLQFRQGSWEVDYAPGVKRRHTRSTLWLPGETEPRRVGDDTPLVLQGYRFYTTPNKGFAPLLSWQPAGGAEPVQGVLHMPSYPLFDWKQENGWTAPDGTALRFHLRIERPLDEGKAWTLSPRDVPAVLVVEAAGLRRELRPGDTVALPHGTLRYERLMGWMGYRVFYDPTLIPLLLVALVGVAGLAWHLWRRVGRLQPAAEGVLA